MKKEKRQQEQVTCIAIGTLRMVMEAALSNLPAAWCKKLHGLHREIAVPTLTTAGYSEDEANNVLSSIVADMKRKDYTEAEWKKIGRCIELRG